MSRALCFCYGRSTIRLLSDRRTRLIGYGLALPRDYHYTSMGAIRDEVSASPTTRHNYRHLLPWYLPRAHFSPPDAAAVAPLNPVPTLFTTRPRLPRHTEGGKNANSLRGAHTSTAAMTATGFSTRRCDTRGCHMSHGFWTPHLTRFAEHTSIPQAILG